MPHKYNFKKIKAHIKSLPPLKLSGIGKSDIDEGTWKAFLERFFSYYNRNFNTNQGGAIQTRAGKRRSITDIYRIILYYFPDVRITEVYKELIILISKKVCCSAICGDTGLRVYRGHQGYDTTGFLNSALTDEYGVDFQQFDISKCTHNSVGWGAEYTEEDLNFIEL